MEPDWETRRLVAEALHGLPFELSFANSGEQALLALKSSVLPEVVLLEPAMSGISGWEVLACIDADSRLCLVPVLVVTALPDVSAPHGRPVLHKPFTTEQLLAAIARLCVIADTAPPRSSRPPHRSMHRHGA